MKDGVDAFHCHRWIAPTESQTSASHLKCVLRAEAPARANTGNSVAYILGIGRLVSNLPRSGRSAVRRSEDTNPGDIVIADIRIPGMKGIEVTQ